MHAKILIYLSFKKKLINVCTYVQSMFFLFCREYVEEKSVAPSYGYPIIVIIVTFTFLRGFLD